MKKESTEDKGKIIGEITLKIKDVGLRDARITSKGFAVFKDGSVKLSDGQFKAVVDKIVEKREKSVASRPLGAPVDEDDLIDDDSDEPEVNLKGIKANIDTDFADKTARQVAKLIPTRRSSAAAFVIICAVAAFVFGLAGSVAGSMFVASVYSNSGGNGTSTTYTNSDDYIIPSKGKVSVIARIEDNGAVREVIIGEYDSNDIVFK